MTIELEALWGNVVVELDPKDERIGSIWVPEPSREQKLTGKVLSAGEGSTNAQGRFNPTNLSPGDRVTIGRHLGYTIPLDGVKFYMTQERHILAVEGEEPDLIHVPEEEGQRYEYLFVGDLALIDVLKLKESGEWRDCSFVEVKDSQGNTSQGRHYRLRRNLDYWYAKQEQFHAQQALNGPEFEGKATVGIVEALQDSTTDAFQVDKPVEQKWETKLVNIVCPQDNKKSHEWKELAHYQNQGWQVDDVDDGYVNYFVKSMKRVVPEGQV